MNSKETQNGIRYNFRFCTLNFAKIDCHCNYNSLIESSTALSPKPRQKMLQDKEEEEEEKENPNQRLRELVQ